MVIKYMVGALGLIAAGAIGFIYLPGGQSRLEGVFKPGKISRIDFRTLKKSSRPNNFLFAAQGLQNGTEDMVAPEFDATPDELAEALDQLFPPTSDRNLVTRERDGHYRDYVVRTPLMRYPDIVSIEVVPINQTRSSLNLYSRSVYGYSDRGVNKRRGREWISLLTNRLNQ